MSEPQERYCSSYYDKNGLYNDGFPCPPDKYCCQSDEDGHKMCCSSVDESKDLAGQDYENPSSGIIAKKHRQKPSPVGGLLFVDKPSKFSSNSRIDNKSLQTSTSSSSWPVFFNNNYSSLILTACLATAVLILVVLVVVIVVVCFKRRRGHDRATSKRLRGRTEYAITSPAPMGYRMSSSGSSCVTSSTTPSPKTDEQLTIICPSNGEMDHVAEEQKKMLKSLSNHNQHYHPHHHNHPYTTTQSHHHQLNLTQSSFVTSSTKSNHNMLDLMLNQIDVDDDDDDEEEAIFEPPPPMPPTNDFISTTSTNLEFLKAHSLFDSTPLNYYPQTTIKDSNSLQPPPYSVDSSGRFSTFMGPPSLTSIYNNNNPNTNKINNNDFV